MSSRFQQRKAPAAPAAKVCPVCEWVQKLERVYLGLLLDFFNDEKLSPRFKRSFGLCLPHLQMAADAFGKHPNLPSLLEAEREKFAALGAELAEFDRKRDYRFAKEPKGAEQTAWRRVIELFAGRRGVFPRQTVR